MVNTNIDHQQEQHDPVSIEQESGGIKRMLDRTDFILGGVVIVLFVGFAAMFATIATLVISHFDVTQSSYNNLRDQVQQQNVKIDELTKALQK